MLELDGLGWSLGAWVVGISVWTAAVFVLARALDSATKRWVGARIRLVLYAAVLVRLAMPLDFTTPVGLVRSPADASARASDSRASTSVDAPDHAAAASALAAPEIVVPNLANRPANATATNHATPSVELGLGHLILLVYAIGVLGWLWSWRRRARALAKLIAESRPIANRDGIDLREHPRAGPFAHGLRKPVVILPAGLRARLQPQLFDRVLAHERAHHRHRDPWLVALLMLVASVAWPVVPVWLTLRRVRQLLEEAADERALAGADCVTRRAYGRALLELVDTSNATLTPALALGAFTELESRIRALVRPVTTPRAVQLGVGLSLAAALGACMAGGDSEQPKLEAQVDQCDELMIRATTEHDDAEKSKAEFATAIESYERYLDACAGHSDYVDMLYYAGEAHWAVASKSGDSGDFRRAGELFREVLGRDSDYEIDAAYGQLMSTFAAVGWSDDRPAPRCEANCERFPKLPYDADEAAVIASWARYVETVGRPLDGARADQRRMATLFMQHNDFEAARPELEELVRSIPADAVDEAEVLSAAMLIDLLTIAWLEPNVDPDDALRRGDEIDDWLRIIAAGPVLAHPSADRIRDAIPTLRAGVEWKRAIADMAAGEAGDPDGYRRCAERFDALLANYPEHPQRDELERNAEVCRDRG